MRSFDIGASLLNFLNQTSMPFRDLIKNFYFIISVLYVLELIISCTSLKSNDKKTHHNKFRII